MFSQGAAVGWLFKSRLQITLLSLPVPFLYLIRVTSGMITRNNISTSCLILTTSTFLIISPVHHHHHHHYKHQGLDPLILTVSRFTTALANVSSVFQLFSFLVVCSDMISKGFGLVAFFSPVNDTYFM